METPNINSLLEKYLNGTSTPDENAMLETWYMRYENKNLSKVTDERRIAQLESIRLKVEQHSAPVRTTKLWLPYAGIAASIAAMLFGLWFFNSERGGLKQVHDQVVNKADIAPGKNRATLTLADGKVIKLSETKTGVVINANSLKYNDNTEVQGGSASRNGTAAMLAASTPRGGTYQITLADGTKVWLNADSKLEFSSDFGKLAQRIVKLQGEGYFEVAKDKSHPFIVESRGQRVEVLGTHFNINSYAYQKSVTTTLVEGSVQVTPLQNPNGRKVLKPGQQAMVDREFLKIMPVDVEVATAWKSGKFLFKEEKLESILNKLAYWYDVEIVYLGKRPDMVMSGIIERKNKLSGVLDLISATGKVQFKIEGRKVFVMN
jgi:transmembrane sensor